MKRLHDSLCEGILLLGFSLFLWGVFLPHLRVVRPMLEKYVEWVAEQGV